MLHYLRYLFLISMYSCTCIVVHVESNTVSIPETYFDHSRSFTSHREDQWGDTWSEQPQMGTPPPDPSKGSGGGWTHPQDYSERLSYTSVTYCLLESCVEILSAAEIRGRNHPPVKVPDKGTVSQGELRTEFPGHRKFLTWDLIGRLQGTYRAILLPGLLPSYWTIIFYCKNF